MTTTDYSTASFDPALALQLKRDITEEIFRAIQLPDIKFLRNLLRPLFHLPAKRFAELMAGFDSIIQKSGLRVATSFLLQRLTDHVISVGHEEIPKSGPLIIASNHPGAYDALTILSQVPREDLKLVVSDIPFFRNMPSGSRFLIFSTRDQRVRVEAIRQSVRHLQDGGVLLIFPSGRIDPDPSLLEGAESSINHWSRSLTVFLRKVPQSQLVLAITSGVLSREFVNHPLPKLVKGDHERRRLMEFMQVIKQLIFNRSLPLKPKVSFARESKIHRSSDWDMEAIQSQARHLLCQHMQAFYPAPPASMG